MLTSLALAFAVQATSPSFHEVTVYNQGFGLVKETRRLRLKPGRQTVAVEDVAERIEPSSVSIKALKPGNDLSVLEQNYRYDLINTQAILNKSVGQRVRFVRHYGNEREVLEGVLISAPYAIVSSPDGSSAQTYNGLVLKTDDGRIVLNPYGEIEVAAVPAGMISVPTLFWDLEASKDGEQEVELSYLTRGINWNADYVITLGEKSLADVIGWVTINNQSGATYKDAKLKLLAGDVQRLFQEGGGGGIGGAGNFRNALAKADQFQQQNLFEYHLYTLQRPATVNNRETKQIQLLEGNGVKYIRKLVLDPFQDLGVYYPSEGEVGVGDLKPQIRVEFVNSKSNNLGMPLPKGTIKVYQRDASGSVQMLGEDRIDHTPKDETVSIAIGHAFDVVASRKRLSFRRLSGTSVEETFEVEVRNRKDEADTIYLYERHFGDWRVREKSMDFKKLDANTMEFVLNLKAGETRKVTYTVVTNWG